MKNFQINMQGVLQAPNANFGGFGWDAGVHVQLKCHNFGRQESFRGLANIPRMCLLLDRGRTVLALLPPENSKNFTMSFIIADVS